MACESDPASLGDVFISNKEQLLMYVTYCQNKASSDTLYHEFTGFFEEVKVQLKDRLELPDYLIMPVQRITKYTLLLHNFHKSRSVARHRHVFCLWSSLFVHDKFKSQFLYLKMWCLG